MTDPSLAPAGGRQFLREAFHWRRCVRQYSDRVKMWSHVGILLGHAVMMIGWWSWFFQGYPGVQDTLRCLGSTT